MPGDRCVIVSDRCAETQGRCLAEHAATHRHGKIYEHCIKRPFIQQIMLRHNHMPCTMAYTALGGSTPLHRAACNHACSTRYGAIKSYGVRTTLRMSLHHMHEELTSIQSTDTLPRPSPGTRALIVLGTASSHPFIGRSRRCCTSSQFA